MRNIFNWLDRFFILLAVLLIGFAIGITFKIYYGYAAKKPNRWQNPPIIVNCIGPEINEETIKRSVDFWDKNKEKIYFYQYEGIDTICDQELSANGLIVLRKEKELKEELTKGTLAITKVYSMGNRITRSNIYFKEGTYNFIYLLEHELGHAFGYTHVNVPGHVMHENYDFIGNRFW